MDRVDLDLAPGEHLAVTGTNGSGKSTLLRAVLGLHRAAGGVIEVAGRHARSSAEWARRRSEVAWVPQRQAVGRGSRCWLTSRRRRSFDVLWRVQGRPVRVE
ncbi:hypothetical protein GCM10009555_034530 [Acrocarpospora macrocephala]|uniref:ABC transporter domain-containing protein n=1 Tax=Acrocarpospora macrocephala TaxID=150177 RepID=A0A5M3WCI7_9ACTN|nr:hypothetical protein Amac_002290 [Acrocarpospora macrocephala]